MRSLDPHLAELTAFNQGALEYYKRACAILAMPHEKRKAAIGDDERLKAEVERIYYWRKENGSTRP